MRKPGMIVHVYNPSTGEGDFEATLGYTVPG
jgi:hypothetical protein